MIAKPFQKDIFQKRMSHSEYLRHAWASPNGFPVLILNLDFFLLESFVTGTFANLLIHLGLQYRLCSEAQLAG